MVSGVSSNYYSYSAYGQLTNEVQNGAVIARTYDSLARPTGYAIMQNAECRMQNGGGNPSTLQPFNSSTDNVWGLDLDGTLQGAGGVGGLLAVQRSDCAATNSAFCILHYIFRLTTPTATSRSTSPKTARWSPTTTIPPSVKRSSNPATSPPPSPTASAPSPGAP